MGDYIVIFLFGTIIGAGLAFIPATLAKRKGYSYGGFWCLSFFLSFIVGIIVVLCLPDKANGQTTHQNFRDYQNYQDYQPTQQTAAHTPHETFSYQEQAAPVERYCTYCGTGMYPGDRYCSKCGNTVRGL